MSNTGTVSIGHNLAPPSRGLPLLTALVLVATILSAGFADVPPAATAGRLTRNLRDTPRTRTPFCRSSRTKPGVFALPGSYTRGDMS